MADRDFSIGERKFKCNKIDAFKQFHIVRRLAPILGQLLPVMKDIAKITGGKEATEDEQFEQIAKFAGPIMDGLSRLSDEDSNKVLLGLLSSVEIQQATGNWAKLASDSKLMFEDIELPVLLQAAGRAFMFNMSGFFAVLPQVSHGKG